MSTHVPAPTPDRFAADDRIAIIAARFNAHIVQELQAGCLRELQQLGLPEERIESFMVPGAFELPFAAQAAARTGRFGAIICLGCVIRGDTPHFDYVAGEAARGIQQASLSQNLPIIFGVLTTHTEQQARDRIGGPQGHAGQRAAQAAAQMLAMLRRL